MRNMMIRTAIVGVMAIFMAVVSMVPSTVPIGAATPAGDAAATKVPSLESLLKDAGVDYVKLDTPGSFKVSLKVGGKKVCTVIAEERSMLTDDPDPEFKIICLYTPVLQIPKDKKASLQLLKRMAEINDTWNVGKLSLNGNSVVYNSSLWQRTADSDSLMMELAVASIYRNDAFKELSVIVNAE